MYPLWIWLVLGCVPYAIERSRTQQERTFSVRAFFWSLHIRLSDKEYYRWALAIPVIEKLQGMVWAVVEQSRRGASVQKGETKEPSAH